MGSGTTENPSLNITLVGVVKEETLVYGVPSYCRCFDYAGEFVGLAIQETENMWMFAPVGYEIWFDHDSSFLTTIRPS